MNDATRVSSGSHLREVALLFLRLGITAFGGPAAHVAMMENEVVVRRRWLSHQSFIDRLGAANLIPGPSSSELAISIGYERAGFAGLLAAGACFVLPSALMTTGLAWAYVRFGSLPRFAGVLYGVKPIVIAIVAQALWGLVPKALKKSSWLAGLGALACVAAALDASALIILLCAGAASLLAYAWTTRGERQVAPWVLPLFAKAVGPAASIGSGAMFLTFLKIGSIVFGSGYVLLAFLRADLVERLHWMTEEQLIDAVAVGQVTPGPVFTTATFIGYLLDRGRGAVIATVGIFLPGFVFMAAIRPFVARVRSSPRAGAFLDGVNVASVALMAVVTARLARSALVDGTTVALAAVSALLLVRLKVNSTWLIAAGATVGALVKWS